MNRVAYKAKFGHAYPIGPMMAPNIMLRKNRNSALWIERFLAFIEFVISTKTTRPTETLICVKNAINAYE